MRKVHGLFSSIYRKNKQKSLVVLGISGSPRLGGNSEILLDRVLEGAQSVGAIVEKIILNNLEIAPCQSCDLAPTDENCLVNDDMQMIYAQIKEADIIIISSPIFFGSLTAQVKIMIDRFQCFWRAKHFLKLDIDSKSKTGTFLCIQAMHKKNHFRNAEEIVRNFFATVGVKYEEGIACEGIDEKGSIAKKPKVLEQAFKLGQSLIKH